jgi:hypothetical protein
VEVKRKRVSLQEQRREGRKRGLGAKEEGPTEGGAVEVF